MRRILAVVVPALTAAALWFGSDALAFAASSSTSPTLSKALRLVAPDTIAGSLAAPHPWGWLLAVANALAVGGAFAALALGLRAGRGRAGFAAAWLAAVLAACIVVVVPALVAMGTAIADPGAQASPPVETFGAAAYWGVIWGWIPAVALLLLAPRLAERAQLTAPAPQTAPARTRAGVIAVAVAAAVALTGVVALTIVAPAATEAQRAAAQAAIPEETMPPAPVGIPIPDIAPGDWQIDPAWCTENQLAFTASQPDAALGKRFMRITATNSSTATCVLEGYADLAFSDPVTNGFETRVLHGAAVIDQPDAGPVPIELSPGAAAVADLTWRAPAHSDRDPAGWMHIAAYPGAVRQFVEVDTDITGGELELSAWRLAG